MIDRTRALIAGAALAALAVAAIVGFAVGRASGSGSDGPDGSTPAADGDGLPAGPSGTSDGVPMGFAQTEDGALAATSTWLPLLATGPSAERPDDIEQVIEPGADLPFVEPMTRRLSIAPFAARVSSFSSDEATVEIVAVTTTPVDSARLSLGLTRVPVTLSWDEQARDWRISHVDPDEGGIDPGDIRASDVEDYQVIHPTGGGLGGVLIEQVPGE